MEEFPNWPVFCPCGCTLVEEAEHAARCIFSAVNAALNAALTVDVSAITSFL